MFLNVGKWGSHGRLLPCTSEAASGCQNHLERRVRPPSPRLKTARRRDRPEYKKSFHKITTEFQIYFGFRSFMEFENFLLITSGVFLLSFFVEGTKKKSLSSELLA